MPVEVSEPLMVRSSALAVRLSLVESASATVRSSAKMVRSGVKARDAPLSIVVFPFTVAVPNWMAPEAELRAPRSVESIARVVGLSAPAFAPILRSVPSVTAWRANVPFEPAAMESPPAEESVIWSASRVTLPVPVMEVLALTVSAWPASRLMEISAPEMSLPEVLRSPLTSRLISPVPPEMAWTVRLPVWSMKTPPEVVFAPRVAMAISSGSPLVPMPLEALISALPPLMVISVAPVLPSVMAPEEVSVSERFAPSCRPVMVVFPPLRVTS